MLAAVFASPKVETLLEESRHALAANWRDNAALLALIAVILLAAVVTAGVLYRKQHPRRSKLHRTPRRRRTRELRPIFNRAALRRLFRARRSRRRRRDQPQPITLAKTGGLPARRPNFPAPQ